MGPENTGLLFSGLFILLFASAMENSMGTDYVSEKVFRVLSSGAVPIYNGAPNIVDFLPHPDAVIHLNQFK
eukprot:CAMPEP_0203773958 /NCGR_PEP_ID=MMETSP0099_2-20121227/4977_1 /ASSEMBLY_ACC=CAM_ASM_000209 /TAXON_ID=96639 /ORGANISM=" , Strain NY0313808BC1" /LENGTH=70 /DNA_ID=CAMNT_0050671907 /DNA_START=320 /DNA_END=529 /DNA_ORIENTATION=+